MSEYKQNVAREKTEVRVRFAPSPTGDLHVGGVRTALFNWLFAKSMNGKFLLRIEDTDQKRSTPEAKQVILDGLSWLSLESDEDVVYQSRQVEQHRTAAMDILNSDNAYRCFCTPEQLAEQRKDCEKKGGHYKYERKCDHLSDQEITQNMDKNMPFSIRLKIPDEMITYKDAVHGEISVHGNEIDDLIILRSNGMPTYMLAVVVDDANMGITHIIRGDDHLSNTPKQILLYRALGYNAPEFVHVPTILGPDKRKLSKRHAATSITSYRDQGYLVETIMNYLGLLGWSPGDDRDLISRQELIENFSLKGINSKSAVFDEKKLYWLNGIYIGKKTYADVKEDLKKYAQEALESELLKDLPKESQIEAAWELLKNRIHFLSDLFTWGKYFFEDPEVYDKKGVKKHFRLDGLTEKLEILASEFEKVSEFKELEIDEVIRGNADKWEISPSELIHPVRLSVSGVTGGPSLFAMLESIGREKVVSRIRKAIIFIQEKKKQYNQ